jgi:phosphohistidine swiveling domain-containing protein
MIALQWQTLDQPFPAVPAAAHKLRFLQRAAEAGLPVPTSWYLRLAVERPLEWPVAPLLQPWILRAAFYSPAQREKHLIGAAVPVSHTDLSWEQALERLWEQAEALDPTPVQRDIFVMPYIDGQAAGRAWSDPDYPEDWIWLKDEPVGQRFLRGQSLTGWQGRLQQLLAHIRTAFGDNDWEIEWVDDGSTCWLVQFQPIRKYPRRDEQFSPWLREYLPEVPSPLMTSLLASCEEPWMETFRRLDETLPEGRFLIESQWQRPVFNRDLLAEQLGRWGLWPEVQGRFPRSLWGRLLKLTREIKRIHNELMDTFRVPPKNFAGCIRQARDILIPVGQALMLLTLAQARLLKLLQGWGIQVPPTTGTMLHRLHSDLAPLRQILQNRLLESPQLDFDKLLNQRTFRTAWQIFLSNHGFRGWQEGDLAAPGLEGQGEMLLRALLRPQQVPQEPQERSFKSRVAQPVLALYHRLAQTREALWADTLWALQQVRRQLLVQAQGAVGKGSLPHAEAVWLLTCDDLHRLDQQETIDPAYLTAQQAAWDDARQWPMQGALKRGQVLAFPEDAAYWKGWGLAPGEKEGLVWRPATPDAPMPEGFKPWETVLVLPDVDPGWLPVLFQACGVISAAGHPLTPKGTLLTLPGVPVVSGVPACTALLKTGDRVRLNGASGEVWRL